MVPCDARARETVRYFDAEIESALEHSWDEPGKILVIDNRNVLHGRASAIDDPHRELQRVSFLPEARGGMTAPYDHGALWVKAKLFLNRAMDEDGVRSFDEQSLWASLALELLAKAALARVSPLLVAEPTEDGTNLLIASGLVKGDARFTSVRATTLFTRCQKAFKPFSLTEAKDIINARNEYLHNSGAGFTAISQNVWWPRFWAQAVVLIAALDKDVEELVGLDRQDDVVMNHLAQNAKNVEHRTQTLIERAKQRFSQYREGTLSARVAAEWSPGLDRSAGLRRQSTEICPACNSDGLLEGEDVTDTEVDWQQISEEDYYPNVTLTVDAEYFSCPRCQLVLDGYELIAQAGLSTAFFVDGDESDVFTEPEYGND
jgi:hypothetical protein